MLICRNRFPPLATLIPHLLSPLLELPSSYCPKISNRLFMFHFVNLVVASWLFNNFSGWLVGSMVERRSLTGELSLVCTGPAADG